MADLFTTALLLATFGLLLAISVIFSRTLERLGVPVVLLFLGVGMLAGSDGIGGIHFDDYRFAFRIGTVALVLILFDAGLNTPLSAVRVGLGPASMLATVGVAGTAGLVAVLARMMGSDWPMALLLGAIVSSTDAAAVFAVLRGGNLRLKKRVGATLELESGLNDPMAVILTVAITESLMGGEFHPWQMLLEVPIQLAVGLGVGLSIGYGAGKLLRRIRLSTGGLFAVLTFALACLAFGIATLLHGSGFLAVFALAVLLGNSRLPYRHGLSRIHDAIAWLSQITMFLTLGLLVYPTQLLEVASVGLAIALFLAFVARPVVVALCLMPFRFPPREIGYIGWVGLRGAVPIILATFPVLADVPGARILFNVVFFIVVVNALIPGATIRFLTRRLDLESSESPSPAAILEVNSTRPLRGELMSFYITPSLAVCDALLSEIPFPPDSSAILIVRGEELLAPRGNTKFQTGDHVYVFCCPADKPFIELLFGKPQDGSE